MGDTRRGKCVDTHKINCKHCVCEQCTRVGLLQSETDLMFPLLLIRTKRTCSIIDLSVKLHTNKNGDMQFPAENTSNISRPVSLNRPGLLHSAISSAAPNPKLRRNKRRPSVKLTVKSCRIKSRAHTAAPPYPKRIYWYHFRLTNRPFVHHQPKRDGKQII